MTAEGWHRLLQITGAALGVPAAAAGTFAAYQSYFSTDVTCHKLRSDIVSIMEKNVAPETKRSLLKKDVTEFDTLCGDADPEARIIFQAAITEHPADATHADASAGASPQRAPRDSLGVFGAPSTKDHYGWVAISRRQSAPGCRISPVTRFPIRRCRLLARFYPRKSCCRSGPSRNLPPTIRARCTAVCPRGPACACWPRAAGADDYGPRSRLPRARELMAWRQR